ncbi:MULTISPECIES: hypothetical protein [unclassified Cyanobium]|uniref:hypothetical protein n=1 Tax=unclassified Cyanobium TaxID=2627006 RepID=UPI0020CD8270|nr:MULTISPECIES: hypothetical protein [unclassified Cyanobium]MCP9858085.1 hypothetical protein [Cyanobium sp. Cruz-8H5]MCP9865300.1 hypothetical protein [Cyanobium sp. Cruz-8D1]
MSPRSRASRGHQFLQPRLETATVRLDPRAWAKAIASCRRCCQIQRWEELSSMD